MSSAVSTVLGANFKALADFAEYEIAPGRKVGATNFYIRQEPYYSTSFHLISTGDTGNMNTASVILAGSAAAKQKLFQGKVGQTGTQGSNWALSWADTNNEMGTMFDSTQAFIGVAIGIEFNVHANTGALAPSANILHPTDMDQIVSSYTLSWQKIGGRKRSLGTADLFPSGTGVYQSGLGGIQSVAIADGAQAVLSAPYMGIPENGGPSSSTGVLSVPLIWQPTQTYAVEGTFERSVCFGDAALAQKYIGAKITVYGYRANLEA